MASTQPSTQKLNLKIFGKKLQKINCETFHRKTYFAWFCEFVSNLLSKIVWGNRSLFLTRYRLLDLTFSEDFSIRKAHSLFKLIFKASQLQKTSEYAKSNTLHFIFNYEFGTKHCSSCSREVFMKRFYFYLLKTDHFCGFSALLNK